MDGSLFEDEEVVEQNADILDSLKKEFKIEAPLNFIQAYGDLYRKEKEKILKLSCSDFKGSVNKFIDSFKQFVLIDWQNMLFEMMERHSTCIFDFMVALKNKEILPDSENLKESLVFQKYQDYVADSKNLDLLLKSEDSDYVNRMNVLGKDTEGKWEEIADSNKSYYVVALECASYIRNAGSSQKINTLDVSSDVVITNGLEYSSSIEFDKVVFWEV